VEKRGRVTSLKKIRIAAVKKILLKKNLPARMRDYWVSVLRRIDDPWKQEKKWAKAAKKGSKKKD
jgi:hypothetical protein